MSTEREELAHGIWGLVLASCCAHDGGEPHAVTWSRGGYRNDVPTLCERCEKLIRQLQELTAGFRKQEPVSEPTEAEIAAGVEAAQFHSTLPTMVRAALAAARAVTNGDNR